MRCESCGAEYKLGDMSCPFCNSENPVMADIRKERILKQYDREAQEIRNTVHQKTMKKWTKVLLIICGIVAGGAFLAGIIMSIWGTYRAKIDYQIHLQHEQKMEALLAKDDLEGIYDYMSEKSLSLYEYPKYQEIWDVYGDYRYFIRYKEELEQYPEESVIQLYSKSERKELLEDTVWNLTVCAAYVMQECRQYSCDRVVQGTEQYFEEYYEVCRSLFSRCGITDEQLAWMSLEQEKKQEDPQFGEIVNQVVSYYVQLYDL